MKLVVRNISLGQLGYQPVCAPSQLLHTWSLAAHGRLEEALDLLSTTENVSVINILLKSKIKELVGGKLTLSQLKPGQAVKKSKLRQR